jgi:hypothetical protein
LVEFGGASSVHCYAQTIFILKAELRTAECFAAIATAPIEFGGLIEVACPVGINSGGYRLLGGHLLSLTGNCGARQPDQQGYR